MWKSAEPLETFSTWYLDGYWFIAPHKLTFGAQREKKMKVICCVCGVNLVDKPSDVIGNDAVSHGLCESCAHHFMAQVGMPLAEYLEGLHVPVLTVTPEGTIGAANQEALKLLGKSPVNIQGFKGGDVFECENARLPGGCGQTVHCSGCTIRNTVMDTVQTGKPHRRVQAYLNQYSDSGSHRYDLLISTEKKGGVVFLNIEEMNEAARDAFR